jgi:hypothetical protein
MVAVVYSVWTAKLEFSTFTRLNCGTVPSRGP